MLKSRSIGLLWIHEFDAYSLVADFDCVAEENRSPWIIVGDETEAVESGWRECFDEESSGAFVKCEMSLRDLTGANSHAVAAWSGIRAPEDAVVHAKGMRI